MENRDLKPVAGWHGELPCAFFAFLRADRHEALKGQPRLTMPITVCKRFL
jgi:hypothetical protein